MIKENIDLTPREIPSHRLKYKVCVCHCYTSENLNLKQGLCNGPRMVIQRVCLYVLEAKILIGTKIGHTVLMPKLSLTPSDTNLSFILKTRQLPLRSAFSMTINKTQYQTFCYRLDGWMAKSINSLFGIWFWRHPDRHSTYGCDILS
ncbi:hypothetical protein LAZ67_2001636 [Cordylochernes scorpioides]|uniref:ATP-dependent DNA helicase n=1 Tax=Cordylochernes scorpioides TaxID=51811 RepID=A0ABY6K1N4_9ARAC|nr:hypothetical protein LAZ67_2001636 [Cordylochernes scorpioides]